MSSSTVNKIQPPKARKRVDVDPSNLKRATNGSAFTRCDSCQKDIPVATADMHDCLLDAKAKASLAKSVEVPKESHAKTENGHSHDKKTSKRKEPKEQSVKSKKAKKVKDPNQPKRPATAFFLFMEDFRKEYKQAHPDSKGVAMVAKEGGDKWKTMSDEEKAVYAKKAAELKQQYAKDMEAYAGGAKEQDRPDDGDEGVEEGRDENEVA